MTYLGEAGAHTWVAAGGRWAAGSRAVELVDGIVGRRGAGAGFSGRCRNCTSPLPATSSAIASCETRICSSDGNVCVCLSRGVDVPFYVDCKILRSFTSPTLDDSLLVWGRPVHAKWGERRTTPIGNPLSPSSVKLKLRTTDKAHLPSPLATDAGGAHVCCPTCAREKLTAAGHVGGHPGRRKLRPACCIHHRRGE